MMNILNTSSKKSSKLSLAKTATLEQWMNIMAMNLQFLLHLKEQLRLLDIIASTAEQLHELNRLMFLQQAVKAIPGIR